ncbi:hypothetical protein RI129_000823 [Pyrocoelia pectoralis]|uniref:Uncharacterized protein n=1 Tax=Pyrocoelia pectoralis TaxID=417401 RepID=A0AAN7VSK3_9COLE
MARFYTFTLFITIFIYRTEAGWEPIDDLCIRRLNLDRKVMEPIVNKALHTFEDKDYLAYTECYWKEYKLINENDEIDWEQIENIVPKKLKRIKNISTVIQTCKATNIQGKSNGEIAVKIQNCIFLTPLLQVLRAIEVQKRNSSGNTT